MERLQASDFNHSPELVGVGGEDAGGGLERAVAAGVIGPAGQPAGGVVLTGDGLGVTSDQYSCHPGKRLLTLILLR